MIYTMAVMIFTALIASPAPCRAGGIEVEEIGSFHLAGREVTLSGLPKRQLSFTAGTPPLMVDPNGDLEVEQMYVHYVRLANPKARYPLLMWHGGQISRGFACGPA